MNTEGSVATSDSKSEPLWRPSDARISTAVLTKYTDWLRANYGLNFSSYESLWQWSISDLEAFWQSVWDFFDVQQSRVHSRVLGRKTMPGAEWFPGATLNYAEHLLRHASTTAPAIIYESEGFGAGEVSWQELKQQVGALATALRAQGIGPGDRVAAYLPNIPQAVVAFIAVASLGATWSICSPDMGASSVGDRFRQIEPKVLIAVGNYVYGGRSFDRSVALAELLGTLPSVRTAIWVGGTPDLESDVFVSREHLIWNDVVSGNGQIEAIPVAFDHPLWIVYSSGTTGLPKGIVHGHGGALAMGLVQASLHWDLKPRDRYFWYSSTGWIMWNLQVMGLLAGSTICLYDGAVIGAGSAPDWGFLWSFVDRHEINLFGAGAAFHAACRKAGISPRRDLSLKALNSIGSTGSPLPAECYRWLHDEVKSTAWVLCTSGGTDIAGAFLIGSPTLPLYSGEMQCRTLGAAVAAYDESGREVIGSVGELVCTQPMPSMPVKFWNDTDNRRYRESYFESFRSPSGDPVWRHGDWLQLVSRPQAVGGMIYGRSDATINRQGIRFGTSELYRAVEDHPSVLDSLAIDLEYLGRPSYLGLFVVLRPGTDLTPELSSELSKRIRSALSPRHLPDEVHSVPAIPYTLTGKKLEVPIKKLLLGQSATKVLNRDAVSNPESLEWFITFARLRQS
jgi:acetoacetyl-CoA synthetase